MAPRTHDITTLFTHASDLLPPGQLIKDPPFTLFEAVGALEIMDPKMDSGFLPPGDIFDPSYDALTSPTPTWREILGIMDQIFQLEILWYSGHPLSQTVYTSLHVDALLDPGMERCGRSWRALVEGFVAKELDGEERGRREVLLAFCVGVVKAVAEAGEVVRAQNFYEEEDFVTHCFGRELLGRLGGDEVGVGLKVAEEWVREVEGEVGEALRERLKFRRLLMEVLTERDVGEEGWKELREVVRNMRESHAVGVEVPEAFSEKVQRKLATSTPPRPMLEISWDNACTQWTIMCEDAMAAFRYTIPAITQSPACLYRAIWAFAYRRSEAPFTLARAILQDILMAGDQGSIRGGPLHYELLLADIREHVLAGHPLVDPLSFSIEDPNDPRHFCSRLIEGFMEKAVEEYLNLYRMVCQNRCRIRRTFTQAISILDALETEAASVDYELSTLSPNLHRRDSRTNNFITLSPLTSWTKFHKLRLISWTIQLGFETDIYLPHELARMYAFLSIIAQQRSELLTHLLLCTSERRANLPRGSYEAMAECRLAEAYLKSLHTAAEVEQLLAEALCKLFSALEGEGAIALPKEDETGIETRRLRYETRMKPYLSVVNSSIPTMEALDAATIPQPLDVVCKEVEERVKAARTLLADLKKLTPEKGKFVGTEEEWKSGIRGLQMVCVAVGVTASRLKGGAGGVWAWERRYAVWWVVPVVKGK